MCDFFWKRMESDQGDLADIVRASGLGGSSAPDLPTADPHLPAAPFPPMTQSLTDEFGDPFSSLRDPLLHELVGTPFFDRPDAAAGVGTGEAGTGGAGSGGAALVVQKMLGEEVSRPCNLFSRMLQISPGAAPAIRPPPIVGGDMAKVSGCSEGRPVDHGTGMQISPPRTPGIKRRKSQAKKVVCIPAPAAASSRPGGEVVPSDLWAWRKYGQKPIKGSPYPRGYYRCSSSKGCSARKQVERSRNDPNMLVITYTSEHNHPWPTQRNALAGSTRSLPAKNGSSASKSSPHKQRPPTGLKEEPKEAMSSSSTMLVKEEVGEMERGMDRGDCHEFDQIFCQSYKPMIPDSSQPDDFFADLAELEPDPMSLIFSKGFMGEKQSDEERENKASDPFDMFDWAGSASEEAKKG